jgi:hypothetical protein
MVTLIHLKKREVQAKMRVIKVLILSMLVILLLSCKTVIEPAKTQIILVEESYNGVGSYRQLIEESTLIVIGKVRPIGEFYNTARNVADITQPDPRSYNQNQVYEVIISETLKGNVKGSSIFILYREWMVYGENEEELAKNIEAKQYVKTFPPLDSNKSYLLFLTPMDMNSLGFSLPERDYYSRHYEPWIFDISNPEVVVPYSPWEFALSACPSLPLEKLRYFIAHPEEAILPTSIPPQFYPAPGEGEIDSLTPYP